MNLEWENSGSSTHEEEDCQTVAEREEGETEVEQVHSGGASELDVNARENRAKHPPSWMRDYV